MELGSRGGPLHMKYLVYLDRVAIAAYPENYEVLSTLKLRSVSLPSRCSFIVATPSISSLKRFLFVFAITVSSCAWYALFPRLKLLLERSLQSLFSRWR